MWKKDEAVPPTPMTPRQGERTMNQPDPTRAAGSAAERATIGRSIIVKGEIRGDEDLIIQGQVDGSVDLKQHAVTVGGEGRVKANISARIVTVEGLVEGDLKAKEQVILRSSARVQGDLTAPRVVLEDGASFRGLVDMGEGAETAEEEAGSRNRSGGSRGQEKAGASGKDGDAGKSAPAAVGAQQESGKDTSDSSEKGKG